MMGNKSKEREKVEFIILTNEIVLEWENQKKCDLSFNSKNFEMPEEITNRRLISVALVW